MAPSEPATSDTRHARQMGRKPSGERQASHPPRLSDCIACASSTPHAADSQGDSTPSASAAPR